MDWRPLALYNASLGPIGWDYIGAGTVARRLTENGAQLGEALPPAELTATTVMTAAGVGVEAVWDRSIYRDESVVSIYGRFERWHNQSRTGDFPAGIPFCTDCEPLVSLVCRHSAPTSR